MFSVNTNAGAFSALQNLTGTNQSLSQSQSRINTGLKVASARDDGAAYSIAQRMRGDIAGLNAAKSSLDRASSEVDVALAGAQAVSDLLISMKEKAVAAKDDGLDAASRTALNDDFVQLRDQITSIVQNASFNGKNLLTGDAATAITTADGSSANTISTTVNQLTLSSLSLDGTNLITKGSNITGTAVALAGVTISAGTDADFRAALVNLQNANGGTLGGESINASTGVTTDNVTSGFASNDFQQGVATALGINVNEINGTTVDGFAFAPNVSASSQLYLVRNGGSSYLTVGNPGATGDATSPVAATDAVTKIDAAISTVNTTLSKLGSTANRLDIQKGFATKLSDSLSTGVGNIVDADMAKESANLQAFQTKQQLGLQALSIANQAPQTILSLFR